MSSRALGATVRVDADDVVLYDGAGSVGDTFIFEPTAAEQNLGSLFAVAETDDRAGVGRELLETVVQALQREYYRDPTRPLLPSFESALHQANLVLYDLAEDGVRDWMGSFHVAAGILSGTSLHVSTAGEANVLLSRGRTVTSITSGLSHSPVTDPLRTFSQVASGVLASRDILFFTTSNFDAVYRPGDLTRFSVDGSAATVALRLRQLYEDRSARLPLAALVVAILPKQLSPGDSLSDERGGSMPAGPAARRDPVMAGGNLSPRKPLVINRSLLTRLLLILTAILRWLRHQVAATVWPRLTAGGRTGGRVLISASSAARRRALHFGGQAQSGWTRWRSGQSSTPEPPAAAASGLQASQLPLRRFSLQAHRWPMRSWRLLRAFFGRLPRTSKVLAVVAIILTVALASSLLLLQRKRTADQHIQLASELLHEARTKQEAAATALIYDNRDQARLLLTEAEELLETVAEMQAYAEQVAQVQAEIENARDRLAKVTRISSGSARVVGDFSAVLPRGGLTSLLFLQGELFTWDSATNAIAKMLEGGDVSLANQTTSGIGFFVRGAAQEADKLLVLQTDEPGVAVYDAKSDLLQKQEISWPEAGADIAALGVFGNRLYTYNRDTANVHSYSKTLRGYAGGEAWLAEPLASASPVTDIGIDGFVYLLHQDGTVSKFFKGVAEDFSLEKIEPPLSAETSLLLNEELSQLYLLDKKHKRVAIFDTSGALVRQLALPEDTQPQALAVDPAETTAYILSGTQVLAVPLKEGQ